ncbi:MAG: polyketide cyclase [Bacteroidota bacterium]|jgi:uncharacterized protein YndB with AHSA1/START domain|nr:polyketide cyclase [Bacteroidota bacterium]
MPGFDLKIFKKHLDLIFTQKFKSSVMQTHNQPTVTIETLVNVPIEKAWQLWTLPKHIMNWNNASDEWHTPHATNDLKEGGRFLYRMEAKDKSFGFDFEGTYQTIKNQEQIAYVMDDGRKVTVIFSNEGTKTKITESFDPEGENPIEMQRDGWQAILNNFKTYAESFNEI